MKCENCNKREATTRWYNKDGALAISRGFYKNWCEFCVVEKQLAYVTEQAGRIPELARKLTNLQIAEESNDESSN
jgi:hypothetical protein